MNLTPYADPISLLERVRDTLEAEEAKHSLLLGVLAGAAGRAGVPEGEPRYALAEAGGDGGWVAAVVTPPFPLILAATDDPPPPGTAAAIAGWLREAGPPVPGVTAAPRLAADFAEAWERLSGRRRRDEMRMRIHRLRRVVVAPAVAGRLRPATPADSELVGGWTGDFEAEANGDWDRDREWVRRAADSRIERGEIHLWEEGGEPRCMAARGRPTRSTVTVNGVFTPPDLRGRGYATATVAALSRALLEEGFETCVLYTDLANPTSNRIYRRIGYEPVCDSVRYLFGPDPGGA